MDFCKKVDIRRRRIVVSSAAQQQLVTAPYIMDRSENIKFINVISDLMQAESAYEDFRQFKL
jgi:hypothetical protein